MPGGVWHVSGLKSPQGIHVSIACSYFIFTSRAIIETDILMRSLFSVAEIYRLSFGYIRLTLKIL